MSMSSSLDHVLHRMELREVRAARRVGTSAHMTAAHRSMSGSQHSAPMPGVDEVERAAADRGAPRRRHRSRSTRHRSPRRTVGEPAGARRCALAEKSRPIGAGPPAGQRDRVGADVALGVDHVEAVDRRRGRPTRSPRDPRRPIGRSSDVVVDRAPAPPTTRWLSSRHRPGRGVRGHGHATPQRPADLVAGVLLDEVQARHRDLGLVRPGRGRTRAAGRRGSSRDRR